METTYVRRLRMEIDLAAGRLPAVELPDGFDWLPWHPRLIERHSRAKYLSFRSEFDSHVFPCLATFEGCRRLMADIASQEHFVPAATWLLFRLQDDWHDAADVGTIQGMAQSTTLGAIQNVGIHPDYRGMGLGRALVLKCLDGFLRARMRRVYLEVTGNNTAAVELYRSIGFKLMRTMYRVLDDAPTPLFV